MWHLSSGPEEGSESRSHLGKSRPGKENSKEGPEWETAWVIEGHRGQSGRAQGTKRRVGRVEGKPHRALSDSAPK